MRACTNDAETKSGADSVSALTPGAIYVDAHAQTAEPLSPLHDTSVMLDWERGVRTREQQKRKLRNGHDSAYAAAQHTLPL